MGFFILDTDAENHSVALLVFGQIPLEIVSLHGATAGEVLGIEIQNDPLPAECGQRYWLPVLGRQREIRGRGANGRRIAAAA